MEKYLQNWRLLNETLKVATEEQCWELFQLEQNGKHRVQFLIRIYGRYNKLRTTRERNNLAGGKR